LHETGEIFEQTAVRFVLPTTMEQEYIFRQAVKNNFLANE